jgi:transposase
MIKIEFAGGEIERLQDLAMNHIHPHIRTKALALVLKSQEIAHYRIARIIKVSENTLYSYFKEYVQGGINAVTSLNFRKPESKLVPFEQLIKDYLNESPPASIKQACSEITALTSIMLKETQMRKFLKSLGARFRKVYGIPAKADLEEQKKFLETKLNPRLKEAKVGERTVYFVDAAHFVLGAFLGFLWSLTRRFIKTPSGRQRFNVLGALDAVSKKLITITNDTYITSTQVCDLLKLIAQDATGPVTVVLDNARYQRCEVVTQLAQQLGVELLFLPPYSPNLNLIERVWKFTKKKCLNSRYYADFSLFRNTIANFLTNMHNAHSEKLKTLLTLEFQLFENEQINRAV